jgi:hypothetical protein
MYPSLAAVHVDFTCSNSTLASANAADFQVLESPSIHANGYLEAADLLNQF